MTDKHHGTRSGKAVEGKTKDSLRKGGTDAKFETHGKGDKGRSPSDATQLDLAEIIAQAQNGQGLEALSRRFNLDEQQTRAAINQLAPPVMAGIRRETASPDGLAGLIKALASGSHGRYLDGDDTGIVDDGNAILGHIFGSKDVSRGVAAHAAQTSGISDGTLKQMLPMVAAMIMGALGKKTMAPEAVAGSVICWAKCLAGGPVVQRLLRRAPPAVASAIFSVKSSAAAADPLVVEVDWVTFLASSRAGEPVASGRQQAAEAWGTF